ncbi:aryl-alcohol dehydrogenase-like predicted oxidoreductase [Variovorax boronicumulans]|uniref:aldo/keto reductase n=1 Tax=Variovorax boronicumulans TaxID=436515 RepID=UPI0024746E04|nr:aldo/keto reductase [Variovorax boronicumulans]MDH6169016.1 aryl-alcohol dehydrogenase-like predicted oxidoreductase [Variovorax boronicumulans]
MSQPQRIDLAPNYSISRLLKGGWQLAGGHGGIDCATAIADMAAYYEAGITTFDCADIYTGVEELIGDFRREHIARHGSDSLARLRVHTKFVPDLATLAQIDKRQVEQTIDRSLQRLGVERLDLVQFHWWDYGVPRYVEVAHWLQELQRVGKIELLGGTNFDTARVRELVDADVPLRSMQVQYSLLDQRPQPTLAPYCAASGIQLLCYGSVAGGFLSERWLGASEPQEPFENRSLVKYKLVIDDFGGWDLFQQLLLQLQKVAQRHDTSIATVAMRWVLQQPQVAGVIVGVRRGDHLADHLKVLSLQLDAEDIATLDTVLTQRQPPSGDVYSVERDIEGRHGRVMKYDLNKEPH